MLRILTVNLIVLVAISASPLAAQDTTGEPDLARIADDLKFENARHFYDMKLYDQSLRDMNEYLEIFAQGAHRKEAYMTIASIHFSRFDYRKAVKAYTNLYGEYSTSDEGIQAYFNAAVCYEKMGNEKKAREIYKNIIDDHPDSQQLSMARTQLELQGILGNLPSTTSKNNQGINSPGTRADAGLSENR
jgi:TolA-binding protein